MPIIREILAALIAAAALAALALGVAPSAPGFLHEALPGRFDAIPPAFLALYPYAWFVGAFTAGLVYLGLMTIAPAPKAATAG